MLEPKVQKPDTKTFENRWESVEVKDKCQQVAAASQSGFAAYPL